MVGWTNIGNKEILINSVESKAWSSNNVNEVRQNHAGNTEKNKVW